MASETSGSANGRRRGRGDGGDDRHAESGLHRPDQRLDTADLDRRRRAGAGVADLGGTDRIGRHRVATVGNEQSHRFAEERLEGQGEPRRRRRAEPDVEVAGGDAAGDGVGAIEPIASRTFGRSRQ